MLLSLHSWWVKFHFEFDSLWADRSWAVGHSWSQVMANNIYSNMLSLVLSVHSWWVKLHFDSLWVDQWWAAGHFWNKSWITCYAWLHLCTASKSNSTLTPFVLTSPEQLSFLKPAKRATHCARFSLHAAVESNSNFNPENGMPNWSRLLTTHEQLGIPETSHS